MARWLALPFVLALAAAAVYALAATSSRPLPEVAAPLDDIDDASRAKLERVIEHAGGS